MRKKKIYTFDKLLGVNLNDENQKNPSQMVNMIYENGILKKRTGWRVISEFKTGYYGTQRINGIYEFKGKYKSALIVHAGEKLYECSYDLKSRTEIPRAEGIKVKDQKSTGRMHNGRLWLCGLGELLVYDGSMVRRIYENDDFFVPLTARKIMESQSGITGESYQTPNLLTRRRKNSLRGERKDTVCHKFCLDVGAKMNEPFKITAYFKVKRECDLGDSYTSWHVGYNADGVEVSTVVSVELYTSALKSGTTIVSAQAYDMDGAPVTINDIDFGWIIENGRELTLLFDAVSPYKDEDNIVVEFSEDSDSYREFDGIRLFTVVQAEKGGNIMLISCEDNRVYYTYHDGEQLYFPTTNVIRLGQDTELVTAICPMLNGFIGIFKERSFYKVKINTENDGEYLVYPSLDTRGCVSPQASAVLEYDCLAFNESGVFGTVETDNAELVTTRLYNRSYNIQAELGGYSQTELEGSCAVVHKGKYYLFVGGRVYICDPKHKTKGASSKEFSYEWWIFDGCPCYSACSVGDILYMGRKNGEVAVFGSEYEDKSCSEIYASTGDFVITQKAEQTIVFNESLGVKNGQRVRLDTHYIYIADCGYSGETKEISVPADKYFDQNGAVAFFDGMEILLEDSVGKEFFKGKILSTNPSEFSFSIGDFGQSSRRSLKLYLKRDKETEYTLQPESNGFVMRYNGATVKLHSVDVEKIYLWKSKAVESRLSTPAINMGVFDKKTLFGIILTLSQDTSCTVRVGYETRKGTDSKELAIGNYLDFDSIDYNRFVFNPRFKQSIKIPFFERDFDYVKVTVDSSDGKELGVESVSIIYGGGNK